MVEAEYHGFNDAESRYRWTLETMRDLVRIGAHDPEVRSIALAWVEDCPSRDRACEVAALWDHFRSAIRYRRDPVGLEWLQPARDTLRQGSGDCDCQTIALGALLEAIGVPVRIVTGSTGPGKRPGHVFLYARLPEGDIMLDPTYPGPLGTTAPWIEPADIVDLGGLGDDDGALGDQLAPIASDPRWAEPGISVHFLDYDGGKHCLIVGLQDAPAGLELHGFWSSFLGVFKSIGKGIWKGVKFIYQGIKGQVTGGAPGQPQQPADKWETLGSALVALATGATIHDSRCGTYYKVVKEGTDIHLQQVAAPSGGTAIEGTSLPFWAELVTCNPAAAGPGQIGATPIPSALDQYKLWILGGIALWGAWVVFKPRKGRKASTSGSTAAAPSTAGRGGLRLANPLWGRCLCSDPGCPCHKGSSKCPNHARSTLYRVDMEDRTGTPMCDCCADDALDSGVFRIGRRRNPCGRRRNPGRFVIRPYRGRLGNRGQAIDGYLITGSRDDQAWPQRVFAQTRKGADLIRKIMKSSLPAARRSALVDRVLRSGG